jgi:hypothetical protein
VISERVSKGHGVWLLKSRGGLRGIRTAERRSLLQSALRSVARKSRPPGAAHFGLVGTRPASPRPKTCSPDTAHVGVRPAQIRFCTVSRFGVVNGDVGAATAALRRSSAQRGCQKTPSRPRAASAVTSREREGHIAWHRLTQKPQPAYSEGDNTRRVRMNAASVAPRSTTVLFGLARVCGPIEADHGALGPGWGGLPS